MTELEKAASTDASVRAYLFEVKRWEAQLKVFMLDAIMKKEKPEKNPEVRRSKANIKRFLNMARVVQKRHNRSARTYKVNTLERVLTEDDDLDFARQALSKIEMHSAHVIEGMRRRRSIFYTKEDIDMIVKPPSEEELQRLREETEEEDEAIAAQQRARGQKIINQYLSTKVPDFSKNPPPTKTEEKEDENGA